MNHCYRKQHYDADTYLVMTNDIGETMERHEGRTLERKLRHRHARTGIATKVKNAPTGKIWSDGMIIII